MNEAEFILRLQKGDEQAFRQLVEAWKDRIYNTALSLLQSVPDAEDLTQEVFVDAWKTMEDFRNEAAIGTWLYKIAVSKSLDQLRHRKRKKRWGVMLSIVGLENKDGYLQEDFYHPGVQLDKKQDAALLFAAIKLLPEQQKAAYTLQKLEGLNLNTIAVVLNISESAVESLLQRAKANLRKTLSRHFEKNNK